MSQEYFGLKLSPDSKSRSREIKVKISVERLVHFNCGYCDKWWSVGDAPEDKTEWFCAWRGEKHVNSELSKT